MSETSPTVITKRTRPKHINILLVASSLILLAIIGLGILLLVVPGARPVNVTAKNKAISALSTNLKSTNTKKIVSNFGFSVEYDKDLIKSSGIVQDVEQSRPGYFSGESFNDDELDTPRNYGIVELGFRNADKDKELRKGTSVGMSSLSTSSSYLTIVANRQLGYFDKLKIDPKLEGQTELDIISIRKKEELTKNGPDDLIDEQKVKINGIDYRQIKAVHRFKSLDSQLVSSSTTYYYLTVQNHRPYWISINRISPNRSTELQTWQNQIARIKFHPPKDGSLTSSPLVVLANSALPDDTANFKDKIDDTSLIKVVAVNQISTVRIGSMRCATLDYKTTVSSLKLSKVCAVGVGSGSIISNDGVVATNGHVTSLPDKYLAQSAFPRTAEEMRSYGAFIVSSGYATRSEIDSLVSRYQNGDESAIDKLLGYLQLVPLSNITISNSSRQYIVQTSDRPIRLNSDGTAWDYAPTNIPANLLAEEVDPAIDGVYSPDSTYTDVALIKMDGKFPTVSLSSLSGAHAGDEVTAVGYPVVVDGGIDTSQKTTVPSVTQGSILDKGQDGGGHMMVVTSAQIASGNSGGPAFDAQGRQIGINTYGGSACEGKDGNSCFGKGVARDADDISTIARKQGVGIKSGGELNDLWNAGLSDFLAGQYHAASSSFRELDKKYPDNYMISKFLKVAEGQPADEQPSSYGTAGSESLTIGPGDDSRVVLVVVVLILGVMFVITAVLTIVFALISRRNHRNSQPMMTPYGQPAPAIARPVNQYQAPYAQQPTPYTQQPTAYQGQPSINQNVQQTNQAPPGQNGYNSPNQAQLSPQNPPQYPVPPDDRAHPTQ